MAMTRGDRERRGVVALTSSGVIDRRASSLVQSASPTTVNTGRPSRPTTTVLGNTNGVQARAAAPSASSRIGSVNGVPWRKRRMTDSLS